MSVDYEMSCYPIAEEMYASNFLPLKWQGEQSKPMASLGVEKERNEKRSNTECVFRYIRISSYVVLLFDRFYRTSCFPLLHPPVFDQPLFHY